MIMLLPQRFYFCLHLLFSSMVSRITHRNALWLGCPGIIIIVIPQRHIIILINIIIVY